MANQRTSMKTIQQIDRELMYLLHINENPWIQRKYGKTLRITEDQRNCMKICRNSLKINASQRTHLENARKTFAH